MNLLRRHLFLEFYSKAFSWSSRSHEDQQISLPRTCHLHINLDNFVSRYIDFGGQLGDIYSIESWVDVIWDQCMLRNRGLIGKCHETPSTVVLCESQTSLLNSSFIFKISFWQTEYSTKFFKWSLWTKIILKIVNQSPNNVIDAEIATNCTMVGTHMVSSTMLYFRTYLLSRLEMWCLHSTCLEKKSY